MRPGVLEPGDPSEVKASREHACAGVGLYIFRHYTCLVFLSVLIVALIFSVCLAGIAAAQSNTGLGSGALVSNTTGGNNTAIGFGANVSAGNLNNATAIGAGAIVNASNKIRLGNTTVTVIEGQVAFTASSDKTKKENFQPVDGEEVLGKIRGFELSSWNFIGHDPKEFRHYGPMAQDFFAAFGQDGVGQIGTETTINSGDLAGILMIAVQALEKRTAEIKQKEAQIAVLASKVEELTAKYAYLETVAARLEGVTIPQNVLVRADRVIKAERLKSQQRD